MRLNCLPNDGSVSVNMMVRGFAGDSVDRSRARGQWGFRTFTFQMGLLRNKWLLISNFDFPHGHRA